MYEVQQQLDAEREPASLLRSPTSSTPERQQNTAEIAEYKAKLRQLQIH